LPFTVLFAAIGAMMLAGLAFTVVMPHKRLRGRAEAVEA
jgi:hypothetical protein